MKLTYKSLRLERPTTDDSIFHFYASLDCARSLTAYLLFKYKEYDQLVSLKCNPSDYSSAIDFQNAYLASEFLSKNKFLPTSFDRKKLALEKFDESERKCLETNRLWKRRDKFSYRDWHYISCIANKIFSILGPSPNIDEVIDRSSWGPGASLQIKRREASSFKKFRDERGITADASSVIPFIDHFYPHLAGRMFSIEHGDRVVVVPKNSKIDRVILIQPGWNLWFQKGIGSMIRSKLRSKGLDLDVAPAYHHSLARQSSIDGQLATVDFSSASDQIAIEPLREVLPPDWFRLLDFFRSKRSSDALHTWEKFSSMGNGFTFELESLIFYAIALVSNDLNNVTGRTSVFGDDVILPIASLSSFRYISNLFGFTINPSKTFSDGFFRESCGAHFYNGIDCKPVFLKEKISDVRSAFKFYNAIRSLSHRLMNNQGCDSRFKKLCKLVWSSVPTRFRYRIPFGYGDVGLISNFDEATPSKARFGYQGYFFKALVDRALSFESEESSILYVRLTEHSDVSRHNNVEIKSRTKVSIKRILAFEWYDLGPWY
jgi:hypothetical protein